MDNFPAHELKYRRQGKKTCLRDEAMKGISHQIIIGLSLLSLIPTRLSLPRINEN